MRLRRVNVMWLAGMAFCLLSGVASAQGPGAVRKQVEASMLLKGEIDIGVDGAVEGIGIERETEIPSGVASFFRDAAMQWTFEPIVQDGVPVAARAPMSVRLTAKKLESGDYEIRIVNASFDRYDPEDRTSVRFQKQKAPSYPADAIRAGVAGDVYALVKVGRDGRVVEVVSEQVNLHAVASERAMRTWREVLARASEKAIKDWTFLVPSEGAAADKPYWVVRVPIRYRLSQSPAGRVDHYGTWEAYIPGPLASVPWRDAERSSGDSPDALVDGGIYMDGEGRGPRLLTPLDRS